MKRQDVTVLITHAILSDGLQALFERCRVYYPEEYAFREEQLMCQLTDYQYGARRRCASLECSTERCPETSSTRSFRQRGRQKRQEKEGKLPRRRRSYTTI